MENTIHNNDYILISRQAYTFGDHQRGDIVVVRTDLLDTREKNKHFVKRIIGLPGDRVAISDGKVLVNGKELTEEYTKDGFTVGEMSDRRVPKDKLFVLGDNRQDSLDSRNPVVGFVPNDRVFGKVIFRLFPFNQIGTPE
jgi:signal peptidase I